MTKFGDVDEVELDLVRQVVHVRFSELVSFDDRLVPRVSVLGLQPLLDFASTYFYSSVPCLLVEPLSRLEPGGRVVKEVPQLLLFFDVGHLFEVELRQDVHFDGVLDVRFNKKVEVIVGSVDNRRFEVDVLVVRDVVEGGLIGRNRKCCDALTSLSVCVKVSHGIDGLTTDCDEPKSPVDIDLTAVRQRTSCYHGIFFEAEQRTEVFS